MGVLSDRTIRQLGLGSHDQPPLIEPFDPEMVQPASYDLHLGADFRVYNHGDTIDPSNLPYGLTRGPLVGEKCRYILSPGEFILGSTIERVNVPNWLVAQVEGKSSLARLGLLIHVTAGFCDPGFQGTITLEFFNCNSRPILLSSGMKIAQLSFTELDGPAEKPYGHKDLGSHYQGQTSTTESRYS